MRTNIVIDDDLMRQVMKLTGLRTKREAVELGLKALLRLKNQEAIRKYATYCVARGENTVVKFTIDEVSG